MPLNATPYTHGGDTEPMLQTPGNSMHSPHSPANRPILEKIIEDVPGPSLFPRERDDSLLSVDSVQDGSSDTGIEDTVEYTAKQYDYGDEADDGYADEDDSMDLSDAALEEVERDDGEDAEDEPEYVWSEEDTIEDIMNIPGKTAPPARQQDLEGIYVHDQPTPDETKEIRLRRNSLEQALRDELQRKKRQNTVVAESYMDDAEESVLEHHESAFEFSGDKEIEGTQDVQAHQSQADTSAIDDNLDGGVELEVSDSLLLDSAISYKLTFNSILHHSTAGPRFFSHQDRSRAEHQ
jgi:hypothetical protein